MNMHDVVNSEVLAMYLTADYGEYLAVWEDGEITISTSFGPEYYPVAVAKCPGIDRIDYEYFTEEFCDYDEHKDAYVVTGKYMDDVGRVIGDFSNVVRECCRDGDMSDYLEGLIEELEESQQEDQ